MRRLPSWMADAGIIAGIVLLDRISKIAVISSLKDAGQKKLLGILSFTYVENTGAAFGMLQGNNLFFIVVTVLLAGVMFYYRSEVAGYGRAARWGLLFAFGGALGNLYDRLVLGRVIDFIDFRIWPVFNIADSFITIGGILMAWTFAFSKQEPKPVLQQKPEA